MNLRPHPHFRSNYAKIPRFVGTGKCDAKVEQIARKPYDRQIKKRTKDFDEPGICNKTNDL